MDNFNFDWQLKTRIVFGHGKVQLLGELASAIGTHALLVTGKSSLKKSGKLDEIIRNLDQAKIKSTVFEGVERNPRTTTINKGSETARASGCDIIIGVGGGSVMDAAKAMALEVTTGNPAWDYIVIHTDRKTVPDLTCGLILVPTMNATGSEMNGNSVITNEEFQEKSPLSDPKLAPDIAIIDPELTSNLPWEQTAYALIDITSHILEPYLTASKDVPLASHMIEGVLTSLVQAGNILQKNPADPGAACTTAWAGAIACSNLPNSGMEGYRYCHHIEHVLSAFTDVPHALGLAIIIPRWMKIFKEELSERLITIAPIYSPDNETPSDPDRAILIFQEWLDSLGLKTNLSELGFEDRGLSRTMAESLMNIELLNKSFSANRFSMDTRALEELYISCFNEF